MKCWLAIGLFALLGNVEAASFDCQKATTLVEKAICSDQELSALDWSLAKAFRAALADSARASQVRSEQIAWMSGRDACQTVQCLTNAYKIRIAVLTSGTTLVPMKIGECVDAHIMGKATRFDGATPGESGGEVNVQFDNAVGIYVAAVAGLAATENADKYMWETRDLVVGDKVKLCLESLPRDCPPGDERGKGYSATGYRTSRKFSGIDSWHMCGGA